MNILTTEERKELQAGHYNSPAQFFDAIAAAVINRLAAGVSVEPAFRLMWKRGAYFVDKPEIGDTDCYTAAAIAAARVQATEACIAAVDEYWGENGDVQAESPSCVLRALLGKEQS